MYGNIAVTHLQHNSEWVYRTYTCTQLYNTYVKRVISGGLPVGVGKVSKHRLLVFSHPDDVKFTSFNPKNTVFPLIAAGSSNMRPL